jgi:hypothetical protein
VIAIRTTSRPGHRGAAAVIPFPSLENQSCRLSRVNITGKQNPEAEMQHSAPGWRS